MDFNLVISPLAELDIAEAYAHYADISFEVLSNFDKEIEVVYQILEKNPFFKIRYKNVRGLPLKNFPYIIFYTLDELDKNVEIRSVFNTNQHPKKYR
jgi:plasmid stabilization system protein ParE